MSRSTLQKLALTSIMTLFSFACPHPAITASSAIALGLLGSFDEAHCHFVESTVSIALLVSVGLAYEQSGCPNFLCAGGTNRPARWAVAVSFLPIYRQTTSLIR